MPQRHGHSAALHIKPVCSRKLGLVLVRTCNIPCCGAARPGRYLPWRRSGQDSHVTLPSWQKSISKARQRYPPVAFGLDCRSMKVLKRRMVSCSLSSRFFLTSIAIRQRLYEAAIPKTWFRPSRLRPRLNWRPVSTPNASVQRAEHSPQTVPLAVS